jgi:hypothetical protein
MGSRYTKKILEYVYFIGSDNTGWIEGPYVRLQKDRQNRKFILTEVPRMN